MTIGLTRITQRQAPQFRALITNAGATVDGQTFDVATWVYRYTEDFQNEAWYKTDAVKLYATLTSL